VIGKRYLVKGDDVLTRRKYSVPVIEIRFNEPLEFVLKEIGELMVSKQQAGVHLSTAEVARKYGVSQDVVKDNCARGALGCIKKGKMWLVDSSVADKFYSKRKKQKR
jgi:hypothetical protein